MDLSFLAESDLLVTSIAVGAVVVIIGIALRMSGRTSLRSPNDRHR